MVEAPGTDPDNRLAAREGAGGRGVWYFGGVQGKDCLAAFVG